MYKIPLSKFLIDRSLYEDYNKYVEQYVNKYFASFDETKVMQVMFGGSEAMPSQAGVFHLYDIRLE